MPPALRLHPDWQRPLSWLGALAAYIQSARPEDGPALHVDAREPSLPVETVREMLVHACEYVSEGRPFAEVVLVEEPVDALPGDPVTGPDEVVERLRSRPPVLSDDDALGIVLHARWAKRLVDAVQAMRDRALFELTAAPTDPEPLVTVRIPTYGDVGPLVERTIPSVLGGAYRNVELLVCSDGPQPHARAAVEAIDDPRVRYLELDERPIYPKARIAFWHVAGCAATNRLLDEARGDFVFCLDHDDAFTHDHIVVLLEALRRGEGDFGFGQALTELQSGPWTLIGSLPLRYANVVHASVGYSRRLAHMRYDADCWLLGEPADWNLWRRMQATGAKVVHVPRPITVHFKEGSSVAGREPPADVLRRAAADVLATPARELLGIASQLRGARLETPAARRSPVRRRERPARRLAVVDTRFPWALSGFRWHEARALVDALPDTVFFAHAPTQEAWPRPVYPLVEFEAATDALGITDVYAVFLNLGLALTGLQGHPDAAAVGGIPDGVQALAGRRLHLMIYPGGGLVADTPPALLRALAQRCATVFSNADEVLSAVPDAIYIPGSIATRFYEYRPRRPTSPFRVVFTADDRPRKGLDTLLAALPELGPDVHVHVVGPHERFAGSVAPERATFHGVLAPEQLRGLYWATDAFVAPVRPEGPDGAPGEVGLVDGFPTTAACEALAAGCALIHSNPRGDHRVLEPDVHYLEIPGRDPAALATAVRRLAADRALRDELALNGATRVREAMDVDAVVAAKLQTMGLGAA